MTWLPIHIAPIAKFALADAAGAYEASRVGYRELFLNRFADVVARIEIFPESCPVIEPGVRRALFSRPFPFCVLYRIDDTGITIADVLPTASHPDRWTLAACETP